MNKFTVVNAYSKALSNVWRITRLCKIVTFKRFNNYVRYDVCAHSTANNGDSWYDILKNDGIRGIDFYTVCLFICLHIAYVLLQFLLIV